MSDLNKAIVRLQEARLGRRQRPSRNQAAERKRLRDNLSCAMTPGEGRGQAKAVIERPMRKRPPPRQRCDERAENIGLRRERAECPRTVRTTGVPSRIPRRGLCRFRARVKACI